MIFVVVVFVVVFVLVFVVFIVVFLFAVVVITHIVIFFKFSLNWVSNSRDIFVGIVVFVVVVDNGDDFVVFVVLLSKKPSIKFGQNRVSN